MAKIDIDDKIEEKLNQLARSNGLEKNKLLDLLLNPGTESEVKKNISPNNIDDAINRLSKLSNASSKGEDLISKMINLEAISKFRGNGNKDDDMGMADMMKLMPKMKMMQMFMDMIVPKKEEKSNIASDLERYSKLNEVFNGGKNRDEIKESIENLKKERNAEISQIDARHSEEINALLNRIDTSELERKKEEEERKSKERDNEIKERIEKIENNLRVAIDAVERKLHGSVNTKSNLKGELSEFKDVLTNLKDINTELVPKKGGDLTNSDGSMNFGKVVDKTLGTINNHIAAEKEVNLAQLKKADLVKPENIFKETAVDRQESQNLEPDFVEQTQQSRQAPQEKEVITPEESVANTESESKPEPDKKYIGEIGEI